MNAFVILGVAVLNRWSIKSAGILLLQIQLFTEFCSQVVHSNTLMLSVHPKLFLDGPHAAVTDESQ